ncbi:MAG TPA: Crp/Fnr family transcriptional regulator [Puia sp.]|jgi:CRP-like cAMP-binding protein|nr:Crp/Fnr family transcriptional regulator [Puia sp.]
MKEILNYLSQTYWKITEEVMNYVLQKCDEITLHKGEILLQEGKVCHYVWFIKKGLLRAYRANPNEPDKLFTSWFMKEGDIATSVNSFFRELPSEDAIAVVEDTVAFRMSRKDLFSGMERFSSMGMLTTLIIIKYYCDADIIQGFLRMKEPGLLFQHLLDENHEILQRALQEDLASFLGVTEPTFRKIKSGKYRQKRDERKPAEKSKSKKKK